VDGSLPAHTQTFILRLWNEAREIAGAVAELRGEVKHVPSGAVAYFQGLEAVPGALRRVLERLDEGMNAMREDEV
jgi:hypothetical protein